MATGAATVPGGVLQASTDLGTIGLGLLTQLGDVWFVALLTVAAYWLGPHAPVVGPALSRDRAASVVALLFLAVALSTGLKAWFAVERPPGGLVAPTVPALEYDSVVAWLAGASGYALPSGHGVLATAAWGGLAWAIRRGSVLGRAAVAAAVVVAVGATRVLLALHTPPQVLAGVAVGLGALLAVVAISRPLPAFGLAAVGAAVGVVAVGPHPELLAMIGLAVGAGLAWNQWGDAVETATGSRGAVIALGLGVPTLLPVLAWLGGLEEPSAVPAAVSVLAGAAIVVLPLVGTWLAERLP